MATPGDRSPLDSVLNFVPQGHEKHLKQAFYNAATFILIVILGAAVVSVYYVFEIFIKPLMWATLCGTVLYPFKYTLHSTAAGWLQGLEDSSTPLMVGAVAIPLTFLNFASEQLGSLISRRFKMLIAVGAGLPAAYVVYWFLDYIFPAVKLFFTSLYNGLNIFSSLWVWTIIIAYMLALIFWWTPQSRSLLTTLSVPVWILLLLHLSTVAGWYRIPIFFLFVILVALGYTTHRKEQIARESMSSSDLDSSSTRDQSETTEQSTSSPPEAGTDDADIGRPARLDVPPLNIPTATSTPQTGGGGGSRRRRVRSESEEVSGQSVRYIYGVIWACVVLRLWIHMGLIFKLVPIFLGFWLIKKVMQHIGAWDQVKYRYKSANEAITGRMDALIPSYIRGLGSLFLAGDRKVIGWLKNSLDMVISVFIILAMFIAMISLTVMMAVQIQSESMTLIQVTGDLVNDTVSQHPELQEWLPETDEMHEAMSSMLNNAYLYGREWLAEQIRNTIGGDNENIEKQVLEIWDQLYVQWVIKNGTEEDSPLIDSHESLSLRSNVNLSMDSVYDMLGKVDGIDLSGFMTAFQENIETVKSILESVWLVLKGNMNLIASLLTTILYMILEGGTAILNFVISFVVFMTTLFYLLSFSDKQYLPMKWISSLTPVNDSTSNKYGQAVENSIRGVFGASIKMSTFYGLYTWLTHTIFGLQIVYVPSALAALFGAIPFVGTYWAAVPGVIELLVHGEKVLAVMLFVVQMLPMYVVDTAIYSDIKGGGHPYLTGLAVAGGIYCYGLEGAIIGPILLCVLLVAVNIFSTMIQGTRALPATPASPLGLRSQPRERRLRFERSDSG
ncbi:transmembrane protein 245-like [Lytechinus pictus]|uniref:transmembrane protein 245-like n=1 Tax=Lytechinus pictus TaxID=7653 RepID=UPI00240D4140|nr:transmembrane protein 245-like [Lytechinus pictus]